MKAILFDQLGGPEVLKLGDAPKPEVRPGWVLIKNHAVGINFADNFFRQGQYLIKPKLPDTPGQRPAQIKAITIAKITSCRSKAFLVQ